MILKINNLVVVELNEFNVGLLKKGTEEFNLKNIKKLLKMNNSDTISTNNREHFGLDPWVQWVSIHTGYPHEKHQIDHLADIKKLKYPQIWETIGEKGYTSGIWGVMNSSRNNSKGCKFFFPDPWTYSEEAYPKRINNFLSLPRYYSKNYLSFSVKKIIPKILKLLKFLFFNINAFYIRKEIIFSIKSLLSTGLNDVLLFCLFDLFSVKVFMKYKQKYDPNLSIIFFNSLAHAQHKDWSKNGLNKNMKMTLFTIDRILGVIFNNLRRNDSLLILNGLGQKNVDGADYFIYRQNDPELFLKMLGIKFLSVEQCMTNESHVMFKNNDDLQSAYKLLKNIKIKDQNLLYVEKDKEVDKKLFFQLDYFNSLNKKDKFMVKNNSYMFFEHFSTLARRTGAHSPHGKAFYQNFKLDKSVYNHEINGYINNFFSD